jgi:hypothetical protein
MMGKFEEVFENTEKVLCLSVTEALLYDIREAIKTNNLGLKEMKDSLDIVASELAKPRSNVVFRDVYNEEAPSGSAFPSTCHGFEVQKPSTIARDLQKKP